VKFHERLKILRTQTPMLQKDIAAALGVSNRAFQRYESGMREPDIEKLMKLADLFDVSIDYLVGYRDE
jgi:transcriptional regulator with XRE-family HTH domain